MRTWIVAAGVLLGSVAGAWAHEMLHRMDDWVVALETDAAEGVGLFCIMARIGDLRAGETLSLAVYRGGSAQLSATNRAWAETPPEGPFALWIDGRRWTLGWTLDGGMVHATIADAGGVSRIGQELAAGAEASLRDRTGAPLLEMSLDGGGPAVAALDRCVGTRLEREPD